MEIRESQRRRGEPHTCWRVFYTKSRAEKQCEVRLRAAGLDVFLPKRRVIRQWSDRKKKVIEPLFSGYFFANVCERGRLDVLEDPGIVGSVRIGRELVEMPQREVDSLLLLQKSQTPEIIKMKGGRGGTGDGAGGDGAAGDADQVEVEGVVGLVEIPPPSIGSEVEVEYGVMKGLRGQVLHQRGKDYLIIRVNSIGQAVKVNLPMDWGREVIV